MFGSTDMKSHFIEARVGAVLIAPLRPENLIRLSKGINYIIPCSCGSRTLSVKTIHRAPRRLVSGVETQDVALNAIGARAALDSRFENIPIMEACGRVPVSFERWRQIAEIALDHGLANDAREAYDAGHSAITHARNAARFRGAESAPDDVCPYPDARFPASMLAQAWREGARIAWALDEEG